MSKYKLKFCYVARAKCPFPIWSPEAVQWDKTKTIYGVVTHDDRVFIRDPENVPGSGSCWHEVDLHWFGFERWWNDTGAVATSFRGGPRLTDKPAPQRRSRHIGGVWRCESMN